MGQTPDAFRGPSDIHSYYIHSREQKAVAAALAIVACSNGLVWLLLIVAGPHRSVALCEAGRVGTVVVAEQNLPKRLVHRVDHAKRLRPLRQGISLLGQAR
jgi:hypothetical protein